MASSFLCGFLMAVAVAQITLGVFFALAYALGRREAEYLLFSLLCMTLAVVTAGIGYTYGVSEPNAWLRSSLVTHTGAIASAAINLHFVMRYANFRRTRWVAPVGYALMVFFWLVLFLGSWWQPGSVHPVHSELFGYRLVHHSARPTPLAWLFYALATLQLLAAVVLFAHAYRAGKREAFVSLIGCVVVGAAATNDIFLVTGLWPTVHLLPHGFIAYAFAVASTLLYRYRHAAGELEETAVSLRERTEELRHSHAELKIVQDELVTKQQLAAVGELAAAIAHEVRNPLAVIMNAVAGLRRSSLGDDDREMLLGIVDEETARLNRLVTDLLRYARPVRVELSAVSLAELASRAETLLVDGQQLELKLPDDPSLIRVKADAGLLRLVFDNLVENAVHAMPDGGTLSIDVHEGKLDGSACAEIRLGDTGVGMDEETLARAADPFFTTRPSGTGLGLPIVQRIVEAHAGTLTIDSQRGRGTTVTVCLPLAEAKGKRA